MNNKNVIEINGKQYDAVLGTVIGNVARPSKPANKQTVDGFSRVSKSALVSQPKKVIMKKAVPSSRTINHAVAHKPQLAATATRSAQKPVVHNQPRTTGLTPYRANPVKANHAKPHKPDAAHTLMRTAVHKPGIGFKKQISVQGTLQSSHIPVVSKKLSVTNVMPSRLARAMNVSQSPHISRFEQSANAGQIGVQTTVMHLPVTAAPTKPEGDSPAAPAPQPTNKPLDMFEAAIANATHFVDPKLHSAKLRRKTRRHLTSMAAASLALVVFAGFAVYQNTPGLQIKVAGMQAGIATTTPNLEAAGFAFTGVSSQSGKLTVGFSGQQGATYQLTQQSTSWSSDDMIQNVAGTNASGTPNYQTVQAGSTAIYRFNNSSATWVKNGTWYQVSGKYSLTDQQVKALAENS